jgi:hypothetical protein|tara:strand:+ start:1023 stop:1385 length:363 start_codon:yes stop_codon:yes gene_type:complete
MYEKLTKDNIVMYAIRHYDNPSCSGMDEFYDDMKRFKYIKRLIRKYKDTGVLKERLILNHIIVINNLFGPEAASTLLFFKIEQEFWSCLKPFLEFLSIMPETDLNDIPSDMYVKEQLSVI